MKLLATATLLAVVTPITPGAPRGPLLSADDTTWPQADEVETERDLAVPMRDGVVLRGDLWRPADHVGALPVILARTPYGRKFEEGVGRRWATEGYAVFIQAVRGRDGSEGIWVPWENELQDGYDTIDWILEQEWCNGKIGMTGGSYLGHVQILAAASGHPGLSCVVPLSPGSDGFSDVPFSGGILGINLISWLYLCRDPVLDISGRFPSSANNRNLEMLPLADIDVAFAGFRSEIWQHWVSVRSLADMPGLDPWQHLAAAEHKVPALHIGGVWDGESMATRRNWEQFDEHGGPHQHLVYGPWPHEPNQYTRYADVEYGPEAVIQLNEMIATWYDHWLRGDSDSDAGLPRVQQFVTGANTWLHTEVWPAEGAVAREFHVVDVPASASQGRVRKFQEALLPRAPEEEVNWAWRYDPAVIGPYGRDQDFNSSTRLWFDADDEDALVLATPEFEEDTLLTGPAELELALKSSAVDTDLFVLLVEVDSQGVVRALQRPSPLRVRFREGFDRSVAMEPGDVYSVRVPLARFAHLFRAGTRLGIALRSDWFPTCARNLGTLEPMTEGTRMVVQENQILSGGGHVSALRLYQLP